MTASGPTGGGEADPIPWTRADLGWMGAIGLVSLALRLAYVHQYAGHPIGRMPWVDEGAYWTRAVAIGEGHWLPDGPFYQDPLLPYALAALMGVVGPGIASLRVALACVGALTPLVVFWAGRRGLGRFEGVFSGFAAAFYGPLIFTDGLLEKEGLGALVGALALAICAEGSRTSARSRPGWMVLGGWMWGLLGLFRANALVVGLIGVAWNGRRPALAVAFAIGFVLALAPVVAINRAVGRPPEWLGTTWQAGANFFVGNGPGATGAYWAPDFVEANPAREADDFAAEARRRSGRPLTPGQVSRYWFVEGLRKWREAPIDSLQLLARKVGLLFHDFEIPDNQDSTFVRVVAAPRLAWGVLSFGWIIPWAALGLMARGTRSPFGRFLAASTVAGLASTAVFFVVARYRIPWIPGLTLLGAAGVVDSVQRVREGRWRSLGWRVAVLALPAGVLAWRPLLDPAPDRWGHAEIALAVAELGESHLEPAIDALDDARAIGPGPASRVGELTAGGPVRDRLAALVRYRLEIEGNENNVVRRARWLRQLPESRAESRRLLDSTLATAPNDRQALRESAAWRLGETGDPTARLVAARELIQATQGKGGDPSAAILRSLLARDVALLPHPEPEILAIFSPRLPLAREILRNRGWY